MKRNNIYLYILLAICIIIIYLVLDYFNMFSFITKQLNTEILGIIVNTVVVIFVFIITYSLVNKKTFDNEQEIKNNKYKTLNIFLQQVYNECNISLKAIHDDKFFKKYIIPKVDFDSTNDLIMKNLKETPFKNEDHIIQLFSSGISDDSLMKNYLEIKDLFQKYINMKITFFDIDNYQDTNDHKELANLINNDKKILQSKLDLELNKLRKKIQ